MMYWHKSVWRATHITRNLYTNSKALQATFDIKTRKEFRKNVLRNKKPVIIQFHATWCGPCVLLSPRLQKSVKATNDKVDLARVDIDQHPEIAINFYVGAVPAIIAMSRGKIVDKFVGLKEQDQLNSFMQNFVKSTS